jgi:hypothetical protein
VKAAEVATDPALVKRLPEFCGMEFHGDIITEQIAINFKLEDKTYGLKLTTFNSCQNIKRRILTFISKPTPVMVVTMLVPP